MGADRYRIRWAKVSYANGYRLSTERMCIAERKSWLGWCAVGDFRFDERDAERDIERDRALRSPLPVPRGV